MKKLFLKIASFGIKPNAGADIVEQTKLVNGISFLGVPICITYLLIFLISGHNQIALVFSLGSVVFALPIFLNHWFNLNVGRIFIVSMAPLVFCTASVLSGKDAGFYLGFIVLCIPSIIIFSTIKKAMPAVIWHVFILCASIAGNVFIEPVEVISFSMAIYLFNLFTVLITTLVVVGFFKIELSESKAQLVEKNKEIIDSITYAKRIQYTLLAHQDFLQENLPEHFVFFKPKDIVSGDFYWATKKDNKFYLAVCDCTGHGVPGAFMSLLNITFLNEAINEKNIFAPHEILNHVRKQLIDSISKEGGRDGMDAILICIEENKITYAAANNSPILLQGDNIISLGADKMPVGKGEKSDSFTLRTIDYKKGDKLFLYTDGYADQFGGPNGKKYKYKTLNNLLKDNSNLPVLNQLEKLEKEFVAWQGNLEQIDDVCIVGIKL